MKEVTLPKPWWAKLLGTCAGGISRGARQLAWTPPPLKEQGCWTGLTFQCSSSWKYILEIEEENERLTKWSLSFQAGRDKCHLKVKVILVRILFLYVSGSKFNIFQKYYITVLWDNSKYFVLSILMRVWTQEKKTYPNI